MTSMIYTLGWNHAGVRARRKRRADDMAPPRKQIAPSGRNLGDVIEDADGTNLDLHRSRLGE